MRKNRAPANKAISLKSGGASDLRTHRRVSGKLLLNTKELKFVSSIKIEQREYGFIVYIKVDRISVSLFELT